MQHKEKKHRKEIDIDCSNAKAIIPLTKTLAEAQGWCTNWVNAYAQYVLALQKIPIAPSDTTILRSFYIPLSDIQNIMQTPPEGIRVYLAIDDTTDPSKNVLKLLVVGVNALNPSQPVSPTNSVDILCSDNGTVSQIYDLTAPCPDQCGHRSDLWVSCPSISDLGK